MSYKPFLLQPDWPAPKSVQAYSTTRKGGYSEGVWCGLNLAQHVNDDVSTVENNRALLADTLQLPEKPQWLTQVHGIDVYSGASSQQSVSADARFSQQIGQVCTVMTADCLPVLFCHENGAQVAAAHAGWKGLVAGVLENTVATFDTNNDQIMAWLGPAIGPQAFEVGPEVREQFLRTNIEHESAFTASRNGHYLADIYLLARQRLQAIGVTKIYGGDFCTYTDENQFYSYRRDGETGRMASLIWTAEV